MAIRLEAARHRSTHPVPDAEERVPERVDQADASFRATHVSATTFCRDGKLTSHAAEINRAYICAVNHRGKMRSIYAINDAPMESPAAIRY
jgi:hypothetical protein